jgi:hypothetical protein
MQVIVTNIGKGSRSMVRKVRDLIRDLQDAGFERLKDRGKGDHTMWQFRSDPRTTLNLDGRPGDDAHYYQEREVRAKIRIARELREKAID